MRHTGIGIAFAAFFAALPFFPNLGFMSGPMGTDRFLVLAATECALILFAALLLSRAPYRATARRPLLFALLFALIVGGAAAVFGVDAARSWWGDSARSLGLFFFFHAAALALILGELLTDKDWSLVRRAIILSAGAFALFAIVGANGLGYAGKIAWVDLGSRGLSFGNETYAGMYLVLAALIGSVEFMRTKSGAWRAAIGACLALIAINPILFNTGILLGRTPLQDALDNPKLLLGFTRASGTVFFAGVAFLCVWHGATRLLSPKYARIARALLAGAGLAGIGIGSMLLGTPGSFVQDAYADPTTLPRFIAWESMKDAVAQRPLLGWGPENADRAFEAHFTPALYGTGGKIEGWFDRAHNIVLDTLLAAGILGLLAIALLIFALARTFVRARKQGLVGEGESVLWLLLLASHFAQTQTAFDVVPTYALLAIVVAYALHLERAMEPARLAPMPARRTAAVVLILLALASFSVAFVSDFSRQASLARSFEETNLQKRAALVRAGLSRSSDFDALRRASNGFASGIFAALSESPEDAPDILSQGRAFLPLYVEAYERYEARSPGHYRALINHAYLLILMKQWGAEDRIAEALALLDAARPLSPGNAVTPTLEVAARATNGDFSGARRALAELQAVAPSGTPAAAIEAWLLEAERAYPLLTPIKISNL